MSQTYNSQCQLPTPALFNKRFWQFQAYALQESLVLASLPTILYGMYYSVPVRLAAD